MVYITRRETFNAAHRLHREDWTDAQNEEVFGKCANKYFHGHNFQLFVTVKGSPDEKTGFIVDLKLLSKIIKKHIVEVVDHRNLNVDVPFLIGKMPSIENMVMEFWKILTRELSSYNCTLHTIKLIETENNYVEYYGE
ncbi:6-carboxytetrahydropterin synthase [bacterium]|nr:6-carboxytetrahydropterin synthase [bacterium]